jgi:hypothetical protein
VKRLLIILMAFLNINFALANENKPFNMLHFEDASCGAWVKSASSPSIENTYEFWFRGFASGYNFGSDKYEVRQGAMPQDETLALYIDKYCREYPLQPFTGAAVQLIKELKIKSN